MSTVLPTREAQASSPVTPAVLEARKPPRILACILCQQRKVKCDRQYPCSNCVRSRVECISSASLPRKRKRRFPERELLGRLRHYEDLLRQNGIKFSPLHGEANAEHDSVPVPESADSDDEQSGKAISGAPTPLTRASSARSPTNQTIRHTANQEYYRRRSESESSDGEEEVMMKQAWNQLGDTNDHFLFGFQKMVTNAAHLHPSPVQIFRLWQIYLQNVDPLLKITHTSSLQSRIIEAADNVAGIPPPLEALMFGIYAMAVFSLGMEECETMFGSSKSDLLNKYWAGCQHALLECRFLRTQDRECLTALYLYLVSLRHSTLPQSLSSMLGMAVRIAQRMGMHSESALAKCTVFEAEMRRRLWWALVLFDARIGELSDSKSPILTPMWDCRIPLNVNDSELRSTMKDGPKTEGGQTEAMFAVVRSALGNVIRHTMFNLFASPGSKYVARDLQRNPMPDCEELDELEKTIEAKYLASCDPDDPLHLITMWTTRGTLAKCRILEHNFRFSSSSTHQSDAQRDAALSYALRMLECDTQLMSAPHISGFLWLVNFYFPLFAYIQVVQILKQRPASAHAEHAWDVMGDNYEARFRTLKKDDLPFVYPFFRAFTDIMFQAWNARLTVLRSAGGAVRMPRIVSVIVEKMEQIAPSVDLGAAVTTDSTTDSSVPPTPRDFGGHIMPLSTDEPASVSKPSTGFFPGMPAMGHSDLELDQIDWSAMDWSMGSAALGDIPDFMNTMPQFSYE